MFEYRVNFNSVGGLTRYFQRPDNDYVLLLKNDTRNWCSNTLGYVPSLETEKIVDGDYVTIESWNEADAINIGLYFHEEQDAMLFYIAHAEYWFKSSFVLRYCPIAG